MKSVLDRVRAKASSEPSAPAVEDVDGALSYGQFVEAIDAAAAGLRAAGVSPGDRVGICLPNSVAYVVSMYAALWADAVFVPIPHEDPPERKARILTDAAPALWIGELRAPEADGSLCGVRRTSLAELLSSGGFVPGDRAGDGCDLAYLVYTSGSTAAPKGVAVPRESLASLIRSSIAVFGFDGSTRALCLSPFHFDGAFGSIFSVIAAGGCLVISRKRFLMPGEFFSIVRDRHVTHTSFSPSYLRLLVEGLDGADAGPLRTIGLGGEDCSRPALVRFFERFPQVRIFNRYGPTETTVAVSSFEITERVLATGEKIPIGKPHPGVIFHAVRDGRAIRPGEIAELCIGGSQLMRGYWNAPELTARAIDENLLPGVRLYRSGDLVTVNERGDYVFVDRSDDVVNRNGNRIGLTEVSAALRRVRGVTDAVCIAEKKGRDLRLVAFACLSEAVADRNLYQELAAKVPQYMLPDRIKIIDGLPMTAVGKVDLAALRRSLGAETSHEPDRRESLASLPERGSDSRSA